MTSFKWAHFAKDIIMVGVRWYVAYPLSYRHKEHGTTIMICQMKYRNNVVEQDHRK